MATQRPSAAFRKLLREKILARIEQLQLEKAEAAERLGISVTQMSRLADAQDIFSLDRLVDAAVRMGLDVRMTATRPYRQG
jgi:predicted XRE-type DNA-binding protein